MICLASAKPRDTLVNIRKTREFVVNLAGTELVGKVVPTAKFSPPEADEFKDANPDEKPSEVIRTPGIAGVMRGWNASFSKNMRNPIMFSIPQIFLHPDSYYIKTEDISALSDEY